MARRTNRVAWGPAALLTVALVGGSGTMLARGVWINGVRVRLAMTDDWRPDGHREGEQFPERGGWEVTQFHGVCFVGIAITQFETYSQRGVFHRAAGPPASAHNGTGQ